MVFVYGVAVETQYIASLQHGYHKMECFVTIFARCFTSVKNVAKTRMAMFSGPIRCRVYDERKLGHRWRKNFSPKGYKNNITAYYNMISPMEFTIFV